MAIKIITGEEWRAKATELFGDDARNWKFKCPNCGHVQTIQDFIDNGVEKPANKVYYSCIGRWIKSTGCNWTLGGLLKIHETEVINSGGNIPVFEFAEK